MTVSLTVAACDALIAQSQKVTALLYKLKKAVTGFDEFGEDENGKCRYPGCKCSGG